MLMVGYVAHSKGIHNFSLPVKCPQKPVYFNFVLPRQTQLVEGQKGKEDSTMEQVYFKYVKLPPGLV